MSIIFGIRTADSPLVATGCLEELAQATERFAQDGTFLHSDAQVGMGFQSCYTHERSKLETQPATDRHGNLLGFDGRLDNHEELRQELGLPAENLADSLIVLSAFERWGERCFARLVGDWALAFWSKADRSLYLARDHAGTRTLYFEMVEGSLLWSTCLDSFFTGGARRDLDEAYISRYLARLPIGDLTPYKGIRAVTPAHYLCIQGSSIRRKAHWNWLAKNQILYRTDAEYDEHFLALFRQAVERRTGPGTPILAELSGGMDSSSIVCMSDCIRKPNGAGTDQLLDTISYYDDSEPNWDERPYFTAIERMRKKEGIHVRGSIQRQLLEFPDSDRPRRLWPAGSGSSAQFHAAIDSALDSSRARIVLSGHGGDELLGGVPTPLPELADELVRGRLISLVEHSMEWCLFQRHPLAHQISEVASFAFRMLFDLPSRRPKPPSWLQASSTRDGSPVLASGLPSSLAHLPSALSNGRTWWAVLETLPTRDRTLSTRPEYRFPFLDRDLVDFLLRVPRRRLAAPGRRRLLMRRALRNVVPDAILERRRKAFITKGPLQAFRDQRERIEQLFTRSLANEYGFIHAGSLQRAVRLLADGLQPALWPFLVRAIDLEIWLRSSADRLRKPSGVSDAISGEEIRNALRNVRNAGRKFEERTEKK